MAEFRAILIAGPTASGKSAAALALAEALGGVVVNADSMQVYRELRILTARPSAEDETRAPHRLYGTVAAADAYSVGRWLEEVRHVLADAASEGRVPILVGGTGLYFKALLEGLAPVPDIPDAIRSHWRGEATRLGAPALHERLRQTDPVMAARLRPSDPQRLVRALEVLEATGRSLSEWQEAPGRPLISAGDALGIVIAPDRDTLRQRIDDRFAAMVAAGGLEEARSVMSLGLDPALPAIRAHGVRPLISHLRGEQSLDDAIAASQGETRRYAKRQFTWLKRNMISWRWIEKQDSERIRQEIFAIIDS